MLAYVVQVGDMWASEGGYESGIGGGYACLAGRYPLLGFLKSVPWKDLSLKLHQPCNYVHSWFLLFCYSLSFLF